MPTDIPLQDDTAQVVEGLANEIDQAPGGYVNAATLRNIIDTVLAIHAPEGDIAAIKKVRARYLASWRSMQDTHNELGQVLASDLDDSWRGHAAGSAAQALGGLTKMSSNLEVAFKSAYEAMDAFTTALMAARKVDNEGRVALRKAKSVADRMHYTKPEEVDQEKLRKVLADASHGCRAVAKAASTMQQVAEHNYLKLVYASRWGALSAHIQGDKMDPLTYSALAYIDPNLMSTTDIRDASSKYSKMTNEERKKFDEMVKTAPSPEASRKLWQDLAEDKLPR
ncbi:hypothetical protein D5S18_13925 [Nocardia panacis]|uniref:Uncharacterized protein n=1 Tax=Nocardia panacis TaxID=2340916 RepID=A0A3A4KNR7_9NOCA|nr:hypothetical protein [Nocardia panacis]RJO75864.1 hypothetical protein D5S18_13925 [Nocardia panacis]